LNALFNSDIKTITPIEGTNLNTIEFETTIPMSTIVSSTFIDYK